MLTSKTATLSIALAALTLGCHSTTKAKGGYRLKAGDKPVVCNEREVSGCGLSLTDCNNSHEYHCLHGIDLELAGEVPEVAPVVPPSAPAPASSPALTPAQTATTPPPAPAPAAK